MRQARDGMGWDAVVWVLREQGQEQEQEHGKGRRVRILSIVGLEERGCVRGETDGGMGWAKWLGDVEVGGPWKAGEGRERVWGYVVLCG